MSWKVVYAFATQHDDDQIGNPLPRWARLWLCVGLTVMVVGMAFLPSGPSFNPGKPYQYLLAITLYLPVVWCGFRYRRSWPVLMRQPLMPWILALLAWAAVTLVWSNARRPADEILRLFSIAVFLFAWHYAIGNNLYRIRAWVCICVGMLAVACALAIINSLLSPAPDGRLVGIGVMANANLMAATLACAFLWLLPWDAPTRHLRLIKWGTQALLVTGLCLCQSRAALAALFIAVTVLMVLRPSRVTRGGLALLGIAAATWATLNFPMLVERGWSHRPELMSQAWNLFLQHPVQGSGLGAEFVLWSNGIGQTHAHNLLMQLAIETGLPGVLLWSAIWMTLGYRAWRCRTTPVGQITLGLWIFASIQTQFDLPHLLDSPRPAWLLLWFPIAMSLSSRLPEKRRDESLAHHPDLQLAGRTGCGIAKPDPADAPAR